MVRHFDIFRSVQGLTTFSRFLTSVALKVTLLAWCGHPAEASVLISSTQPFVFHGYYFFNMKCYMAGSNLVKVVTLSHCDVMGMYHVIMATRPTQLKHNYDSHITFHASMYLVVDSKRWRFFNGRWVLPCYKTVLFTYSHSGYWR
jgi:hypothetical protein